MESACVVEQKKVVHELTQGIQMAKKLRANLNSVEAREFLINKILSSYDKALFILKSGHSAGQSWAGELPTSSLPDSSISTESPQSVGFEFDQPFTDRQGLNGVSKKRKASTWEHQVRVRNDNGLEGDTYDGYSWRKYGQKDILGAKFPRSYYRCTYSKVQKCLATKQVQRTDEDPRVFEIIYKGKHTCNHVAQSAPPPPSPEKHDVKPTHHHDHQLSPPNPSEMLSNLRANLSVNTTDLSATVPSSFSFPSTPFGFLDEYQQIHFPNYIDEELLQGYSPSFNPPDTPESNHFTGWATSPPMDFLADQADVHPDFIFNTSFL